PSVGDVAGGGFDVEQVVLAAVGELDERVPTTHTRVATDVEGDHADDDVRLLAQPHQVADLFLHDLRAAHGTAQRRLVEHHQQKGRLRTVQDTALAALPDLPDPVHPLVVELDQAGAGEQTADVSLGL